jgi:hypothetical protein
MYDTRESWLEAAITGMSAELFAPAGIELPHTRVALGWPKKKSALGECWSDEVSSDGSRQIFISPKMVEPINDAGEGILEVLAHELCHAALPFGVGHGPRWKRTCRQIDLIPLPKGRSQASPQLVARLNAIADRLGEFPHARLDPGDRPKQTTRLIKCDCPMCGYVVRTTRQWIEQFGPPLCPNDDHRGITMAFTVPLSPA